MYKCPDCEKELETVRKLTDHITQEHKILKSLNSGANRKSLDPLKEHHSPLDNDLIHVGGDGIEVKLLAWPDKSVFDLLITKATLATRGGKLSEDEPDPIIVEDAYSGGLNQCLEWVTVIFEISGISRGLTHEIVRTRKASFAQQSMRHTDMGEFPDIRMPQSIIDAEGEAKGALMIWWEAVTRSRDAYRKLVEMDIPFQDARTVLPIATETYIVAEYPLSEFLSTYAYRSCYMFYPEIVYLFRLMRLKLLEKCPWLEPYILTTCEKGQRCNYQGWEQVEGHCPMPWAIEEKRAWKSRKFDK